MRPRLALALSLLAASALHAVILLAPRPAGQEADAIPTVEISLLSELGAGGGGGGGRREMPVIARQAPQPRAAPAAAPAAGPPAAEAPSASPSAEAPTTVSDLPPRQAEVTDVAAVPGGGTGGAGGTRTDAGVETGSGSSSGGGNGTGQGSGTGPRTGSGNGTATGFRAPSPRADIVPPYPRSARRAGWEGLVRITAQIDESGIVTSADVTASSGHSVLDEAALTTVRQTLFEPARQDGKSIACRVIIPVRFQLR
jgi:periplasmic protein TonB